jgi:hypothetical protein
MWAVNYRLGLWWTEFTCHLPLLVHGALIAWTSVAAALPLPLLLDRAPVHVAIGIAVASGSPGGSLSPSCCALRVPCHGDADGSLTLTSTALTQRDFDLAMASSSHGGHV